MKNYESENESSKKLSKLNDIHTAIVYNEKDAASLNMATHFIRKADRDSALTQRAAKDKDNSEKYDSQNQMFIPERLYSVRKYEKDSEGTIHIVNLDIIRSTSPLLSCDTSLLKEFNNYDLVIFLSKHRAASGNNAICVHSIGNFCSAEFGGDDGRLVLTNPAVLSSIYRDFSKEQIATEAGKYAVSFEAVHHGPYSDIPSIFVEIGATEKNWNDLSAAEIVAGRLLLTLKSEITLKDSIFILGGNHYCAAAYDFIGSFDFAGSCAKHSNECITQAHLKLLSDNYDHILLDYNSLKDKQRITELLDSLGIKWFRTKNFRKMLTENK